MRTLLSLLVGAVLALVALAVGPASGADRRLDHLFERLRATEDPHAAAPIAIEIWAIWATPPADKPKVAELMARAEAFIVHGSPGNAIAPLDEALALAPDFAEAWNRRATACYLAGDYDRSAADIARVLALEPRHFGALSGLGLVNQALGRQSAALAAYEAALALNPHLADARIQVRALKRELARKAA